MLQYPKCYVYCAILYAGLLRRRLQSSFVLLSDYTSLTLTHIVLYQPFFDSQCQPPYDCKLSVMLDLFGVFKVFQPLRGMVCMYGTIPVCPFALITVSPHSNIAPGAYPTLVLHSIV